VIKGDNGINEANPLLEVFENLIKQIRIGSAWIKQGLIPALLRDILAGMGNDQHLRVGFHLAGVALHPSILG
jgi:hypothetical protein